MESSLTNANVEAHRKAKAQYTRARTQATRNSWHEKTASLNMEKYDRPVESDKSAKQRQPLKKQNSHKSKQ